jgi:hypothetical protein
VVAAGLSFVNRSLNKIPKRAEQRQAEQLRETFVDSGVSAALEAIDHQVLYGRRGTGKTHALRYLQSHVASGGDVALYADLRTIGSPEGLFAGAAAPTIERAARLLVDLLGQVHESLLAAVLDDDDLITDAAFVGRLDALAEAITTVRVSGEVEVSREGEQRDRASDSNHAELSVSSQPAVTVQLGGSSTNVRESREKLSETRRGTERASLNFAAIGRALRELAEAIGSKRIWLLFDEWSSVPPDIQPYLGEFLVRCVLPVQKFTVKIAAIEQQTNFRSRTNGNTIGIELGADVAANIDLDEFMVFEQSEERARAFFKGLLFKHLTSGVDEEDRVVELRTEDDLIPLAFTDKRAFDELVRAAEGVPRDAINIAAKAALQAGTDKMSVPQVRSAARAWFQTDKEAALRADPEAPRLLNWIIDRVIRDKRARGFLVNQKSGRASLMVSLFDARVLHLVRRGYSAQDAPGERYDVWVIDYGAYVDLIHTKSAPGGLLPDDRGGYVSVPTQDLRAIRRAILNLDEFSRHNPAAGAGQTGTTPS